MGILEQVTQMKQQGMSDQEIYQNMQSQGISPKQVQDAIGQAQIKNAVSGEQMQQSITDAPSQDYSQSQNYNMQQPTTQDPIYDQGYSQTQQGYDYSASGSSVEVAEQVFEEKSTELKKKIDQFNEFKTIAETKIKNNEERLKRIESSMDKLQSAILEKIGSYGTNLDTIKNEMGMMQDSFSKMIKGKVSSSKK